MQVDPSVSDLSQVLGLDLKTDLVGGLVCQAGRLQGIFSDFQAEPQGAAGIQVSDGLAAAWSLDGLTTLVYGVPKRMLGLPLDVKPTPELRAAQRSYFALLYRLLVGRETGPRLPTLLLAIGAGRVRELLAVGGE